MSFGVFVVTEATIFSRHQKLGPLENLNSSRFCGEQQWKIQPSHGKIHPSNGKIQPSNGKMNPDWRCIVPILKMGGFSVATAMFVFLKPEGSHFSTARRMGFSSTSPKVGAEPMVCWDWEWNSWGFSAGWWVKERGTDGGSFPVVSGVEAEKKGRVGFLLWNDGVRAMRLFFGWIEILPPKKT